MPNSMMWPGFNFVATKSLKVSSDDGSVDDALAADAENWAARRFALAHQSREIARRRRRSAQVRRQHPSYGSQAQSKRKRTEPEAEPERARTCCGREMQGGGKRAVEPEDGAESEGEREREGREIKARGRAENPKTPAPPRSAGPAVSCRSRITVFVLSRFWRRGSWLGLARGHSWDPRRPLPSHRHRHRHRHLVLWPFLGQFC